MSNPRKKYFFLPGALICGSVVLLGGVMFHLLSGGSTGIDGVVYSLLVWVAADYGMRRAKEKEME